MATPNISWPNETGRWWAGSQRDVLSFGYALNALHEAFGESVVNGVILIEVLGLRESRAFHQVDIVLRRVRGEDGRRRVETVDEESTFVVGG